MGSDGPPSAADEVNVAVETTGKRLVIKES